MSDFLILPCYSTHSSLRLKFDKIFEYQRPHFWILWLWWLQGLFQVWILRYIHNISLTKFLVILLLGYWSLRVELSSHELLSCIKTATHKFLSLKVWNHSRVSTAPDLYDCVVILISATSMTGFCRKIYLTCIVLSCIFTFVNHCSLNVNYLSSC